MTLRIGLVSDVHFGPEARHEGRLRKLSAYAEPLLETFVARMNDVDRPDLVVSLGDAIEDENHEVDRQRYGRFAQVLAGARAEVIHVAGNHDQMNLSDDELCELMGLEGSRLWRSFDRGDWHIVVLCTRYQPGRSVHLPEDQIQWLAEDLAATSRNTLVLLHHPLCEMDCRGNRWFEEQPHLCRVAERRRVRQVLEQSGRVRAVVCGHAHWNHLSVIAGIPYITLQSLIENVDDDAPGRAARAHALLELGAHDLRCDVRGEAPCHYQVSW